MRSQVCRLWFCNARWSVFFFRFLFEHSWPEALQSLCDHEGEILRAKINMLQMAERASLVAQAINNSPANAGDTGLTPGSERSPGERNGTPLRYSCLKNPTDRRAWQATVHGVAKSWTWLSYSAHTQRLNYQNIPSVMYMSEMLLLN